MIQKIKHILKIKIKQKLKNKIDENSQKKSKNKNNFKILNLENDSKILDFENQLENSYSNENGEENMIYEINKNEVVKEKFKFNLQEEINK